ncbi:hypothetical protein BJ878DRAFT_495149 [Calycina marina]|uniref:Cytochrome c oxidase polypeptide VIIA n=1 Tax=Calycina marina TaxID=1763456 RepID=A0A9P7Z7U3_9HELO|nr:hypothetical protein BJ878DRAFT_495149 [Calycina marina]
MFLDLAILVNQRPSSFLQTTIQIKRPRKAFIHLKMPIKPITGMLRRTLVLDLSIALGLGTTFGYAFWYGYHVPAVRQRDVYYSRLEDKRAAKASA